MKSVFMMMGLLVCFFSTTPAEAQMMRPPAFSGGVPGKAMFQSLIQQRQQARALLYREALEELRKNPAAADMPACDSGVPAPCLALSPEKAAAQITDQAPAVTVSSEASTNQSLSSTATAPRRFAVLVGNNQYAKPIPPLETPISDVTRIANILESRFGFAVRVLQDAGRGEIVSALNDLALSVKPEDHVLLFYAGHGYLMEDLQMGFWIPVDASVKTAKGWISNSDITKMLSVIPARQLILISDSCYSGSLAKEQQITDVSLRPDEILKRRSVVVLSSGGDEPVSDEGKEGHSIFAWNFIRAIEGLGVLTRGVEIWRTVHHGVRKDYPQEAQYGAVLSAGHVAGGDFVFSPVGQ